MYPTDGTNSKRELNEWEVFNCPWYIETYQWSISFDHNEKTAFSKLSKGEKIPDILFEMKIGAGGGAREACIALLSKLFVYAKV